MAGATKDVKTIVALARDCQSRIGGLHSRDASLTSIQQQYAEASLRQQLSEEGITYGFSEGKMTLSFASLYVRDCGVITDVTPVGNHPIQLSVGEDVSVRYEPRDMTQVDKWKSHKLSNARYADLKKGNRFEFAGRLVSCDYWFTQPRPFQFWVNSEFRPPMSPADWLRKWWDGSLPGIEYVD